MGMRRPSLQVKLAPAYRPRDLVRCLSCDCRFLAKAYLVSCPRCGGEEIAKLAVRAS